MAPGFDIEQSQSQSSRLGLRNLQVVPRQAMKNKSPGSQKTKQVEHWSFHCTVPPLYDLRLEQYLHLDWNSTFHCKWSTSTFMILKFVLSMEISRSYSGGTVPYKAMFFGDIP